MLNEETAAKIDHGLAALAMDQLTGDAPPPGQVTRRDLAKRSGVSEGTIRAIERMALAKLQAALMADNRTRDLLPARFRKS